MKEELPAWVVWVFVLCFPFILLGLMIVLWVFKSDLDYIRVIVPLGREEITIDRMGIIFGFGLAWVPLLVVYIKNKIRKR